VLAAEFTNRGKTYRAVWFESADGSVKGYYSPEGKGMRKAFLRAPIDFARVSSGFNPKRRHPITGRSRAPRHRLRRAHRHADLRRRRRPHRVCRPQGRLRQRGRDQPRQGHHHAVRPHVALRQVGPRRRSVRQGEIIATWARRAPPPAAPALRVSVKGVHKNPASIPLPNTEIDSRYVAEFRSQAEVAVAQLRLANSAPGQQLADNR